MASRITSVRAPSRRPEPAAGWAGPRHHWRASGNRPRYNAELMITAFAARLQGTTDLDAIQTDLTATVDRALEPAHLSLWSGPR